MKIVRYSIQEDETLGLLFDEDNKIVCFTLEPTKEMIPEGDYRLGVRQSPKFKRETLWIQDVPNREFILIHAGNNIKDSDGCVLVGYNMHLLDKIVPLQLSRQTEHDILLQYRMGVKLGKEYKVKITSLKHDLP